MRLPIGSLDHLVKDFLRPLRADSESFVVAVSGGPDSVALLRALLAARGRNSASVIVAHFNHRLRGPESDADESFVRKLCDDLCGAGNEGVSFSCERADVAAQAKAERANLEAVARWLRYRWLAGVARAAGARFVATGHTADDQAETILHRLLRGTGLRGLRGIAARRCFAEGVEVIRPLLTATRANVLTYLEQIGQAYRQDSSNADVRFTRNRIRHELLPLLARAYNPGVRRVLCHLAEEADVAFRLEEQRVVALLSESELPRAGGTVILERSRLAEVPRHLVRALFRHVWEREGWPVGGMTFARWDGLARLARGEWTAADLPGGLHARLQERVVQVGPRP